jgi:hypothetical protein
MCSGAYSSSWHCVNQTVQQEGLAALYKGVTPPLKATGCFNSLLLGVHSQLERAQLVEGQAQATLPQTMKAAVAGGFLVSFVIAPMEGVKARLQVQTSQSAEHRAVQKALTVFRTLGVKDGLYRGWAPTAMCRMMNWSYFGGYAVASSLLSPEGSGSPSLVTSVMAGSAAGICYWCTMYPMAVIKNRIQAAPDCTPPRYSGIRDAAQCIMREHGWKGFFAGFLPTMLRAMPANAACFTAYDTAMRLLPP